eukprot:TRINITY_DN28266_c0_g1_i1.p1 TRINITY_DN28266_c0_g1~~TRINITY_DN28266_c0_g1_i1.p1  ORF type:complete len:248 (+),score=51.15 TRINITY_DN28266_c0_g1_i1:62-805(+)
MQSGGPGMLPVGLMGAMPMLDPSLLAGFPPAQLPAPAADVHIPSLLPLVDPSVLQGVPGMPSHPAAMSSETLAHIDTATLQSTLDALKAQSAPDIPMTGAVAPPQLTAVAAAPLEFDAALAPQASVDMSPEELQSNIAALQQQLLGGLPEAPAADASMTPLALGSLGAPAPALVEGAATQEKDMLRSLQTKLKQKELQRQQYSACTPESVPYFARLQEVFDAVQTVHKGPVHQKWRPGPHRMQPHAQ